MTHSTRSEAGWTESDAGDEEHEGSGRKQRRADQQGRHAGRDGGTLPGAAAALFGAAPEGVQELDETRRRQEDAHARASVERRRQRRQEGKDGECRGRRRQAEAGFPDLPRPGPDLGDTA
jgi:hypothetical protein